jgi:UDP-N-acetylmuramate dehydrogenase
VAGLNTTIGELSAVAKDLERICPGAVARDVSLARISRWRIGGPADIIVRPRTVAELSALRAYLHRHGLRSVVIGATSNLLFADGGLRVVCIQIGSALGAVKISVECVTAQAGAWVPGLARRVMQAGLTGAEHICGIPGTLGGLICMNGGSQRKGIGSSVMTVTSIDRTGKAVLRTQADCGFAYRTSVFQGTDEVIAEAELRFEIAPDRSVVRRKMLTILADRRHKFPQKQPNCGSVFKSDPAMYAEHGSPGVVIERLGFKGVRQGGAEVSYDHANFIVNNSLASANDVLSLINRIQSRSASVTGYPLRAEVLFVTPEGHLQPADEAARDGAHDPPSSSESAQT